MCAAMIVPAAVCLALALLVCQGVGLTRQRSCA
jgi:hypothetical protein